jgi:hypothetical protein
MVIKKYNVNTFIDYKQRIIDREKESKSDSDKSKE